MRILSNLLTVIVLIGIVLFALALLPLIGTFLVAIFWISSIFSVMVFFAWLFLHGYQEIREEKHRQYKRERFLQLQQDREIEEIIKQSQKPADKDKEKPLN